MKNLIITISILVTSNLVGFGQKTTFPNPISYNDYIVSCINEVDAAYLNSLDVNQGKEYCLAWCDSLYHISARNKQRLSYVEGYAGEKAFIGSANNFIAYMNKISRKSLFQFDQLLFSENMTTSITKKIDGMAKKLDSDYGKYYDKIETAQKAMSVKYNFTIARD